MKETARSTSAALFTAAALAPTLGLTVRAVQKRLRAVPPSGRALVRGQQALAWTVDSLPVAMRDELAELARRGQYRNTAHLLSDPARGWRPTIDGQPVTLGQVAESDVVDATKLQRALLPSLARITANPPVPAAEATARGLAEYKAEFGHAVSAAHWRRLLNRTIERAGTGNDYPLEIFLPGRLTRRTSTGQPAGRSGAGDLHDLCRAISRFRESDKPGAEKRADFWHKAFAVMESLRPDASEEKSARRVVFRALADSGLPLAKTTAALEMAFSRQYARWVAGGRAPSALLPRRSQPEEDDSQPWPETDVTIFAKHTLEARNVVSEGVRRALEEQQLSSGELLKLSSETTERLSRWFASVSYVPRTLRELIREKVYHLKDEHQGSRWAKQKGAHVHCYHSDIGPGDVWTADDVTLNIYYWEHTPAGPAAMRGQCILFIDVRTARILSFCLHSERNYNARIIRNTFVEAHNQFGLPRKGLLLERGMWATAKLLKGDQSRLADEIPFEQTEEGLLEFVPEIKHAHSPEAKAVMENTIGILQNMMDGEVGDVGRAEMSLKYERIQEKLRLGRAGKVEFNHFLYHKDRWVAKIAEYCHRFNSRRQDGVRLKKRSPLQGWDEWFDYSNPLRRLEGPSRFPLLNHGCQKPVTQNGINIPWRGEAQYYCSADTSPLRGKQVLVWYDLQEGNSAPPSSITVTDLRRRNAVVVPLHERTPSWTATGEQIGHARKQAASHSQYQRTAYRAIGPLLKENMFKPEYGDLNNAMLAGASEEGRAKISAKQAERHQTAQRTAALESQLGLASSQPGRDAASRLKSLQLLKEAEELEAQERENER